MKGNKLRDMASIAEIVGGLAVIISLIFLIIGVGENTQALKRSSYESIMDRMVEWRTTWLTDPKLRNIMYLTNISEDYLEGEDGYIQRQMKNSLYQIYERAFWANEYNQMGESEWERFSRSICGAKFGFWDPANQGIWGLAEGISAGYSRKWKWRLAGRISCD